MFLVKYNFKCSSFFLKNVFKFFDLFFFFFFKRICSQFFKRFHLFFFLKKKLKSLLNSYRFFSGISRLCFFSYYPSDLFNLFSTHFSILDKLIFIRLIANRFSNPYIYSRHVFSFNSILFSFPSVCYFVYRSYFIQNICFFKFLFSLFCSSHFFSFVFLPLKVRKFVFLKSPHVHKKAREQLEIRVHRFLFVMLFFNLLFDLKSILGSKYFDFNIIFFKKFYNYETL